MAPQAEHFENISVNIYEEGSFTKLDERDPDTNFFDDMTKSNFQTSYFKPNKLKPYLPCAQYLEKLNVLYVSICSIKHNFESLKALLEECDLVSSLICASETWRLNTELQNHSNLSLSLSLSLSLTGFDSAPYERTKE